MTLYPLDSPLARGRTAEIYAWENGTVLKLFHADVDRSTVEYEASNAQAVHASGLPVPATGEILPFGERWGLVYERVDGPSMLKALLRSPWRVFAYAQRLAELHAQMHAAPSQAALPAQRQVLENKIRRAAPLPTSLQAAALTTLASLPEGNSLCHGDFHPGNIQLAARGEIVIDWIDAARGNPLADVARTTILLLGSAASAQVPNPLMKLFVRVFHQVYLRTYFHLRPQGQAEYQGWLPVVAAARLSENIPEVESYLLALAQRNATVP